MTIKRKLIVLISTLVTLVVGVSGMLLFKATEDFNNSKFVEEVAPLMDDLIVVAGKWAQERGMTATALRSAIVISDDQMAKIVALRKESDKLFKQASESLESRNDLPMEAAMKKKAGAYQAVQEMRKKVDKELKKPAIFRDGKVVRNWVPTMSELIIVSQDMRYEVGEIFSKYDPYIAVISQLKHNLWVMSEYSGRERAVMGGLIAGGKSPSVNQLVTLAKYRGKVEEAWHQVHEVVLAENKPNFNEASKKLESSFIDKYEKVREDVYASAYDGLSYNYSSKEWFAAATDAIGSIINFQKTVAADSAAYIEKKASKVLMFMIGEIILLIFAVLVGLFSFYVVVRRVANPITDMSDAMEDISHGKLDVEIPGVGRTDEVGQMAENLKIFKENAIEKERLKKERIAAEEKAEEEKKRAMAQMADNFQDRVQGIIQSVAAAATQLSQTSEAMSGMVEASMKKTASASEASEQASKNVQGTAAAAEELAASVNEISTQVQRSTEAVNLTVEKAGHADTNAAMLKENTNNIEEVISLIDEIAEQINLLALNATIEAARAGEAGKGFAVVANEVKNLASQTVQATEEITSKIAGMQGASDEVVKALEDVKTAVATVNDYSSGISSAVEEQTATTNEISQSMQSAAEGTTLIHDNMHEVVESSTESKEASDQVLSAAKELSVQAEKMRSTVDAFLDEIRNS